MPKSASSLTRLGLLTALAAVASIPAAHAAIPPVCQPLVDAALKQTSMPSHLYMTQTAQFLGGTPRTGESIYVGGTLYVNVKGQWRKSPVNVAEIQKQQSETLQKSKAFSCRLLREEAVNGETATVYSEHQETEDSKVDATIWISKKRGVPLKQESDLDVGGAKGKSHNSIRYEYDNVKAPAGAK